MAAVAELRRRCPEVPVYGVIDRDFTEEGCTRRRLRSRGSCEHIATRWKTTCSTRLAGRGFSLHLSSLRDMRRMVGRKPDSVSAYIEDAYRACIDLGGHNRVIRYAMHHVSELARVRRSRPTYREHPDAFGGTVEDSWRLWGQQIGCAEDLGVMYQDERQALVGEGIQTWSERISGKYVLRVFHRRFPRRPHTGQIDLGHYLNEYLRHVRPLPTICRDTEPYHCRSAAVRSVRTGLSVQKRHRDLLAPSSPTSATR